MPFDPASGATGSGSPASPGLGHPLPRKPDGVGKTVHEALADAFVAEHVDTVFCLMGDGNKRWLVDMAARGVRLVHARHEGAALAMADGYARSSERVGVCAVTYGPGVSQLSTSLLVATKHGTPLVVFAADVEASARDGGGHLDVDARALLQAAGARVRQVRVADSAPADVHAAFVTARTTRRPVALLVPVDLQEQVLAIDASRGARNPTTQAVTGARASAPRSVADVVSLQRAAQVLDQAQRVVVLAGQGAVLGGARSEVDALADRLGAVVATTFGAKGWLDDHPRFVGVAGGFALHGTRAVLQHADCVVAVGASLNEHTTDHGMLFPTSRIVLIDIRADAGSTASVTIDVVLRGDAAPTVAALVDTLVDDTATGVTRHLASTPLLPADRKGLCAPSAISPAWSAIFDAYTSEDPRLAEIADQAVPVAQGQLDPRRLMLTLDDALPDDAVVVVGGGHCMAFAAQYLQNQSGRRSFHMVFDFMTTGQAVPAAIGAAVACPGRMVVAVEGDASVLMHIQELETAARSGIGLLIVVVNDGALGAEYHKLAALGVDPSEAVAPTPDLGAVARAFGGRGRQVSDLASVADLPAWFDSGRGPHLADCAVSLSVIGPL